MTSESLISKSGPVPLAFHPTCRPVDSTLMAALPCCLLRGSTCPRALAIFKGLPPYRREGFQRLCEIRMNVTLSRLLRQVLFALGSPPRYQLMASDTFYGLRFAQTQILPLHLPILPQDSPPSFVQLRHKYFSMCDFPCRKLASWLTLSAEIRLANAKAKRPRTEACF